MRTGLARQGFGFILLISGLGCNDVSWPSERNVTSLRILGVRADPASLEPGTSTHLALLCADGIGGPASDPTCNIEVAWFANCSNPENNDPLKCLDVFDAASTQLASPLADTPASTQFAVAPEFEFTSPANVLQAAVSVSGQPVRYGVSYVYFAACAGRLYPVNGTSDRLPVECRDRTTGALLDQRRFVAGYTTIYSYDAVANKNPTLSNIRLDGEPVDAHACAADAECGLGYGCSSAETCAPIEPHCDRNVPTTCHAHCIDFQLPPSSFALSTKDGTLIPSPLKSLWAEYYTNAGFVPDDARFGLAPPVDATAAVTSPCALWQAPPMPNPEARVWVVVRDNRGGQSWIEQRVLVR